MTTFTASVPECVWPEQATLGEGALWSEREQALYWVDILGCRLHRYRPADAERTTWNFDEPISAVCERNDGPGLMVTLRRGFALFDPLSPGSTPTWLHQPEPHHPGNRFNDGKCDARGRFWAGTMDAACQAPTGSLYRFDHNHDCTAHDAGFVVTNGPTWSVDGKTMYFNDTVTARVFAYDFDVEAGVVSNKRPWLRFAKGDGFPDGMTTDAAGRIWIAHWGGACVSCHDPVSAAELLRVKLPTSHITSCAFGGVDLKTLYITSATEGLTPQQRDDQPLAGGLFALQVDIAGVPANRFGDARR